MVGRFELVESFDMVGPLKLKPVGSCDMVGSFEPVASFDMVV